MSRRTMIVSGTSLLALLWSLAGVVAPVLADGNSSALAALKKPAAQPVSGKIDWLYDLGAGQLQSAVTGKPMFIVIRCER